MQAVITAQARKGEFMEEDATLRIELPDGSTHLGTCHNAFGHWYAEVRLRGVDMLIKLSQPGIMVERLESHV